MSYLVANEIQTKEIALELVIEQSRSLKSNNDRKLSLLNFTYNLFKQFCLNYSLLLC